MALAICFAAVLGSGLVMYFSFHVGQFTARVRAHDSAKLLEFEHRHAAARGQSHRSPPAEPVTRDRHLGGGLG